MAQQTAINDATRAEDLTGLDVCDSSGEKVGTVEGAYVDTDAGSTRYVVIRTGWFGARTHVVPMDDLTVDREHNALKLPYDRDHLSSGPTVDEGSRNLSRADEADIYRYYGRPGYWEAVDAKQLTPSATPEIAQADVAEAMARADAAGGGPMVESGDRDEPVDSGRHGTLVTSSDADDRVRWHDAS